MKTGWAVGAVIAVLGAGLASADSTCGAVLCPGDLDAEQLQEVVGIVDSGRANAPEVFDRLAAVRAALPGADAAKRGRFVVIGPALASLGDEALPALLERIVVADPGPDRLEGSALAAWRMGLVEAVGSRRDPRAAAVLETICRHPDTEPDLLTTAAAALGKLETDAAASALVELSRAGGVREQAVLAGMGTCRRRVVAERLTEALRVPSGRDAFPAISRSLAIVANGPVWRAGLVRHPEEGAEIRQLATHALLAAYVAGDENDRRELTTALLVVNDPLASDLIAGYRVCASPELAEALDRLVARLAANPVSRMKAAAPSED
jgi:hypothetical protein